MIIHSSPHRRGAIIPLVAILTVFLLGMAAFALDIGFIQVARSEAQNASDSAALAGLSKMIELLQKAPIINGTPSQTLADLDLAKAEAILFSGKNKIAGTSVDLLTSEVEIGFMTDPANLSSDVLDLSGWPARPYNTIRITVNRDSAHTGGPLSLFLGGLFGKSTANIQATATAAMKTGIPQVSGNQNGFFGGLLPFAFPVNQWNALLAAQNPGDVVVDGTTVTLSDDLTSTTSGSAQVGADGKLEAKMFPSGTTSGNYGTINFTLTKFNNSTSTLEDLIVNGPEQSQWTDLPTILGANMNNPVPVNGDPGLSAGVESAVQSILGKPRVLPLYNSVSGSGNNSYYSIVGFVSVTIVDVNLSGNNKYIKIQPSVIKQKELIGANQRINFSITPSATPNFLFIGGNALVR